MKAHNRSLRWIFENVLPWLVLALLLMYSYAKFFKHSYGFRVSPSSGTVVDVYKHQPEPTLQINDRILKFGSISWEEFDADLSMPFLAGYEPGDTVPLKVSRNGETIDIAWRFPAFNQAEFFDQLISEWLIAYAFWLAAVLTILLVRPKDDSWLLMGLFNFLTAIWLIAGSGLSAYHIWYAAVVLRVVVWLCLPVYLHLHWVFPRPLGTLPRWLMGTVYGLAILLAIAQAMQLLPGDLVFMGLFIILGASFILLLVHLWRQPMIRRDFRLPLFVLILAVTPAMIWTVLDTTIGIPSYYGGVGLLSLSLLPLAYLYTAFRRRLGNLELRVNRFFTIYLFLLLLGFLSLLFIAFLDQIPDAPGKSATIGSASMLLTAAAFLGGYPPFERFVEQRVFGAFPTSKRLLESFSTHITTSVSVSDLTHVLQDEVLPSLLIRQFAFLQIDQGALYVLSTIGLDKETLPSEKDLAYLRNQSGVYFPPDATTADQPYPWIRLVLPLKFGDQILGFWLLGRRDPDDFYSQQEILSLTSLANLTAIALSNILQTERLTSMYQANINRYEEERVSLARDLHDSILNELAALPIRSDAPVFSPAFQEAYDGVSDHLREIVRNLRPSLLAFGLKLALESYAEQLRERNPEEVEILTELQGNGDCRYPLLIEGNVYRIVQEACENALRYAHAKKVLISGNLAERRIELQIADDGKGLDPNISLNFNDLLTHKHFGLAGMHERASVIGAELHIVSSPNHGTQIQLLWKSNGSI